MQQTFLFLPQGALLAIWVLVSVGMIGWTLYRHGWNQDIWYLIATLLGFGLVGWWLIPRLNIQNAEGVPGLAIRGYGFFVALGVLSGVGLASWLAKRSGYEPEMVFSLAFSVVLAGFLGARVFFVVQKWDQFVDDGPLAALGKIVRFYEGGLVVYGSLIGALVAFFLFVMIRKLPVLEISDILAPALVLGLALGRVGCLMNGCCWGGVCETGPAISFPPGSPPYMRHLRTGALLGMRLEPLATGGWEVIGVKEDSRAAAAGLRAGDQLVDIDIPYSDQLRQQPPGSSAAAWQIRVLTVDGLEVAWGADQVPQRSLKVHPAQVYSAINALILTIVLVLCFLLRRRRGAVMALMLTLYPVARFMLETVRSDEIGWQGTELTISQWVSLGCLPLALLLWWMVRRQTPREPIAVAPL